MKSIKNLPNKIGNLNKIKKHFNVPKFFYFNFDDYNKNKSIILKKIKEKFQKKIIIRSASFFEDNIYSGAGKYLSIPDVSPDNKKIINEKILAVFNSYGKNKSNQFILVQEYIKNAETVGVIFTGDPKNGSPFRTINFNNSNITDLITSGKSNGQITYYFKGTPKKKLSSRIKIIEKIIKRLEKNFSYFLDIEFLILKKKFLFFKLES